ncbi:MAG: transglutaminase-like domain-containing protein [Proteobacteria bacterium]|nr:transglutaminase-like domain-containing protein [Pseudomonadota bacterium]
MSGDTDQLLRSIAGLEDAQISLGEAALALAARERPDVAPDRYRAHLAELATAVGLASGDAGDSLAARRNALAQVLHDHFGYAGDRQSYDDLQNANLMHVIDRRKGLPIALGILHIHCGRALGWDICGLNFPGHFLVRLADGPSRMILDPFAGGKEVDASGLRTLLKSTIGADAELSPTHYAPASNRDILIRLQNNRKVRLIKAEQFADALAAIEDMLLFAPGESSLWHEAGLLNAHIGNLRAALVAFAHCRDLTANPVDRARIEKLISEINARLN